VKPYWSSDEGDVVLHLGDCLAVLPSLLDCSVDAIVTDPPYGLEFMGREWDTFKPSAARIRTRADGRTNPADGKSVTATPEAYIAGQPYQSWCRTWAVECLRVLRPGGHLLAFGGTRTYHRLACGIEDAGFEVRDSLHWIYGAGFPKSLDVSKAIDRAAGAEREVIGVSPFASRKPNGTWTGATYGDEPEHSEGPSISAPATDGAARWAGWGTGLKPAHEPVLVARKPLTGTVAASVVEHGTGAINVDGCRVGTAADLNPADYDDSRRTAPKFGATYENNGKGVQRSRTGAVPAGRWPANILLTHSAACRPLGMRTVRTDGHHPAERGESGYMGGWSGQAGLAERRSGAETVEAWSCVGDCPVAELDRQSGVLTSGIPAVRRLSGSDAEGNTSAAYGTESRPAGSQMVGYGDTGGASRFFPVFRYQAKAPASERPRLPDGTAHPTVKPLDLMRWLVRLVTPGGGTVLDLFAGTGTTAEACVIEGFRCVLIEQDPANAELAKVRLSKPIQPDLFGGAA